MIVGDKVRSTLSGVIGTISEIREVEDTLDANGDVEKHADQARVAWEAKDGGGTAENWFEVHTLEKL